MHIAFPSKIYFLLLLSLIDSTQSIQQAAHHASIYLVVIFSSFFIDMDLSDGHAMMHWENKNKNQSSEREKHWKSIKIDCVLAAGFFIFSLKISINCNCINFIVRFESLTRQIQWSTMLISDYCVFWRILNVCQPSMQTLSFITLLHPLPLPSSTQLSSLLFYSMSCRDVSPFHRFKYA